MSSVGAHFALSPLANWLGWTWEGLCPTEWLIPDRLWYLTWTSYKELIKHSQKMFFLMFLINKSVQKNIWSQYQTTLLLNTAGCDYPRNPATPGRLNPFSQDNNLCVLNKKWAGNHRSTWPTSIKPPLHFPWDRCHRKLRQPAGLQAGYAGSQEHSDKWHLAANTTAGWDFPTPPSTFSKGYPVLKSRKTFSRFEVWHPEKWRLQKFYTLISSIFFVLFLTCLCATQSRRFL